MSAQPRAPCGYLPPDSTDPAQAPHQGPGQHDPRTRRRRLHHAALISATLPAQRPPTCSGGRRAHAILTPGSAAKQHAISPKERVRANPQGGAHYVACACAPPSINTESVSVPTSPGRRLGSAVVSDTTGRPGVQGSARAGSARSHGADLGRPVDMGLPVVAPVTGACRLLIARSPLRR